MTVIQNLGIVRHGRRAGSAKKTPNLEVSGRNLVMPQVELERIRKTLTKEADEAAAQEAKLRWVFKLMLFSAISYWFFDRIQQFNWLKGP